MESKARTQIAALLIVPPIVALLFAVLCGLGYLVCVALGIPLRLHVPLLPRACGGLVLGVGFAVMVWVWRYRSPVEILVSTYVSWMKVIRGIPRREPAERSEPLVVAGPHRFVRHPIYAAVMLLTAGWWLVLDLTPVLAALVFLILWFDLVVAPFEERELAAMFGAEYEAYMRRTPRFVPSLRRRGSAVS